MPSIPVGLQSRSTSAISTRESSVSALKNCWEILKCENISFVTLVTGAFPPAKVLYSHWYFIVLLVSLVSVIYFCENWNPSNQTLWQAVWNLKLWNKNNCLKMPSKIMKNSSRILKKLKQYLRETKSPTTSVELITKCPKTWDI